MGQWESRSQGPFASGHLPCIIKTGRISYKHQKSGGKHEKGDKQHRHKRITHSGLLLTFALSDHQMCMDPDAICCLLTPDLIPHLHIPSSDIVYL